MSACAKKKQPLMSACATKKQPLMSACAKKKQPLMKVSAWGALLAGVLVLGGCAQTSPVVPTP
ncbi:MAG: hypothetical protein AB7E41_02855, partial [Mycolicibacterium sp.]